MPDDLFRMAEATARRLHVSRSELYAKAIAEYLKLQQDNAITESLNDVCIRVLRQNWIPHYIAPS